MCGVCCCGVGVGAQAGSLALLQRLQGITGWHNVDGAVALQREY